jgi:4-hydroxybenzoate polyprenyltransferase
MHARLTNLVNRLKNRIPLQSVYNRYKSTLARLLLILNSLKIFCLQVLSGLQQWAAEKWPPARLALTRSVRQLQTFLVVSTRRSIVRLRILAMQLWSLLLRAIQHTVTLISLLIMRMRHWIKIYWPPVQARLLLYVELTRLNKPIGILLLLWPTLWAVWIAAAGTPTLHILLVFTLGVILTRSAGCIFNDMADRKLDVQVNRTAQRPLATGRIKPGEALLLACVLLLIAFLIVLTTNHFTVLLSFVAIPLAVIYPFMKRYTYVPQFFLGLAFSWGIPMAFAATSETIPTIAWLLFIANILWSVIYDTIYAMVDREDDLMAGIKSTAILFDDADRSIIGILQVMFLSVLIITGVQINANMLYYICLTLAAALMVYHQYLIRDRAPEACFRAFLHNNWIGMTIFAGVYLNYL